MRWSGSQSTLIKAGTAFEAAVPRSPSAHAAFARISAEEIAGSGSLRFHAGERDRHRGA
jgi:hypothetical protein